MGQHSGVWFMIARKPMGYKVFIGRRGFAFLPNVLSPTEIGLI
jgi:hypothetical protein